MKLSHHTIPLLLLVTAIQEANALATANDDFASTTQNVGISINVLANDTSDGDIPEGGEGEGEISPAALGDLYIENYSSMSASYGSVTLSETGSLFYTPPEDFVGTDTFTYFVVDDSGYGGTALVTVEVLAEDDEDDEDDEEEIPSEVDLNVSGARNKSVAGMLERICNTEIGSIALGNSCSALSDSEGDLNGLMAEIAPDEALIQRRLLAENSRNRTSMLYRNMAQMRTGSATNTVSINSVTVPAGGAGAGDNLGSSPWTTLSGLQVEEFERGATQNEAGYDYSTLGAMFGLGYRVNNNLNLGAAVDFSTYDVEYVANGGDMDSELYTFTTFLSWYRGPLSIDMQMGYSMGETDAQRLFTFPTTAFADSRYDSEQLNFSTQAEWAWQLNAWALRTFLRVDYLNSEVDSYSETGTSVWLVTADKQDYEQVNSSLGLDVSYTAGFSWGVLIPGIRVSLVNQDDMNDAPVAFELIDANSPLGRFELQADTPDSVFYQWDLSTVFVLQNGVSAFLSGQFISSYEDVDAYQLSGGLNWEF